MHRDKRVGLSLAILLVGIVGAFFFRNDAEPIQPTAQLENAAEVDSRIAEKDVTPYLTGIECEEEDDRLDGFQPATDLPAAEATVERTAKKPIAESALSQHWEMPAFLRDAPDHDRDDTTQSMLPEAAAPPEPIQFDVAAISDKEDSEASPIPNHNNAWEIADVPARKKSARKEPVRKPARSSEKAGVVIHRVLRGETLSAIASRYLGDPNRFPEIYRLNRDILKSPDDVHVGMKIKIPSSSNSGRSAHGPESAPASFSGKKKQKPKPTETAPNRHAEGKRDSNESRFLPARNGIFFRKTSSTKGAAASQSHTSPKRLSQRPPKDVPVVDYEEAGFDRVTERGGSVER